MKALCIGFGLGNMTIYHTGTEGVSNKKYRVTTDRGIYFVKVVKNIPPERIEYISDIEQYMKSGGIPAIAMLKSVSGHHWLYLGDYKYIVYPYIESDRSHKYSENDYEQIGNMLAKMHWVGQKDVPPRFFRDFSIKSKVKDTVIHGDFHPGNILFDPKTRKIVGICDWEKSQYGSRASDLVNTLIYTNFRNNYIYESAMENMRIMFKAYNTEFPISHPEIMEGFDTLLCLATSSSLIANEEAQERQKKIIKLCVEGRIQNDLLGGSYSQ
ncbi:MAG TPA: phosphotransferase [Candidatus Paceibacterota bacterium]